MQQSSPLSPLEDWSNTPVSNGHKLYIKRDDLLPFPFAGNKYRKLLRELAPLDLATTRIVTVGAITSNHCRTTAFLAARGGGRTHLILHGDPRSPSARSTLAMLKRLGATWTLVEPTAIAATIESTLNAGNPSDHFVPGGCHTSAGVRAYAEAVNELSSQLDRPPSVIILASGTGATQAGIIYGCRQLGWSTRVIGISVARASERGTAAVREALSWCSETDEAIEFNDEYRAGGYGMADEHTRRARDLGWSNGLPLDLTYTAKPMAALLTSSLIERTGEPIVFWHTGGLYNSMASDIEIT